MKRITDIQLKEIRGGGSRKNVGTCARLIGGGAALGVQSKVPVRVSLWVFL